MSNIDEIMDALGRWGVHEGWPDERRTMAKQLAGHGWTDDDVDLLCKSIDGSSRSTGAAAASVLADLGKARLRLQDLRSCQQSAPQAAVKTSPELVIGDRSRLRRMAFALVVADHKPEQQVCDLLQIQPDELRKLIGEERQLRDAASD